MPRMFHDFMLLAGLAAAGTACGGLLGDDDCAAAGCGDFDPPGMGGSFAGKSNAGRPGRAGTGGVPVGESGGSGGTVGGAGGTGGKGGAGGGGGTSSGKGGGGALGGESGDAGTSAAGAGGEAGSGGANDDTACATPIDCLLVDRTCCGECEATAEDFVALNRSSANAFVAGRPCTDVICASCGENFSATRQWFGATCEAGHCAVFDARTLPVTECEVSNDCTLRVGLACCEGCQADASTVVSINPDADLSALVCGDELVGCPECAPQIPKTFTASCVSGRCETMVPTR